METYSLSQMYCMKFTFLVPQCILENTSKHYLIHFLSSGTVLWKRYPLVDVSLFDLTLICDKEEVYTCTIDINVCLSFTNVCTALLVQYTGCRIWTSYLESISNSILQTVSYIKYINDTYCNICYELEIMYDDKQSADVCY